MHDIIMMASSAVESMTEEELKQFVFDRLVDEMRKELDESLPR